MMIRKLAIVALAALFFASTAEAKQKHVELEAKAELEVEVVNEDGEKTIQRVPAVKVMPGEVVVYTITARNVGEEPATNVVITDPVPEHMDYTGSVTGDGARVTFSVDGGKTYDVASALTVPVGGGSKPAPPEDYTHIRWTFNDALEPGSAHSVEFRARLQ
ncbi:MAG: DUF11 domain-containing protein [Deltaproteobacteria bacterium]|nr:DUF11 domain-containing protein [Deltaproteobacteria bacterium]MBW2413959.1 DUF11 domain-containing protein [Deltaproteobacteria bacterium]